jgi:hypothetical protein
MSDVFRERSLHNYSQRQSLEIALFWALTGTEYFRSLLASISLRKYRFRLPSAKNLLPRWQLCGWTDLSPSIDDSDKQLRK